MEPRQPYFDADHLSSSFVPAVLFELHLTAHLLARGFTRSLVANRGANR